MEKKINPTLPMHPLNLWYIACATWCLLLFWDGRHATRKSSSPQQVFEIKRGICLLIIYVSHLSAINHTSLDQMHHLNIQKILCRIFHSSANDIVFMPSREAQFSYCPYLVIISPVASFYISGPNLVQFRVILVILLTFEISSLIWYNDTDPPRTWYLTPEWKLRVSSTCSSFNNS